MGKQLFVGNLAYAADDDDLRRAFEAVGVPVQSARVLRENGESRGFGFVVIEDTMALGVAIELANGLMVHKRAIRVEEAKPMERVQKR